MPDPSNPSSFTYLLAEKNGVVVISFVGPLVRDNLPTLEKCREELATKAADWVILSFRDVPSPAADRLPPELNAWFVAMQKGVRDRHARLRLSALHPNLRKMLEAQGLIRREEVVNNLAEALHALQLERAKAA